MAVVLEGPPVVVVDVDRDVVKRRSVGVIKTDGERDGRKGEVIVGWRVERGVGEGEAVERRHLDRTQRGVFRS